MNDLGVDRARLAADAPHVRAARWEATLWPAEHAGRPLLVKDVRHAHPLYRFTVGRWLLAREARVYARMRELPFVPHCHGWLDRDGLILERLDAVTLTRYPEQALLPGFFDQLAAQVAMLHERFIAHLDLRHRSNILVTRLGEPRIVDFATAICLGEHPLRRRLLWPLLAAADRSGVTKWRMRYFPDHVPEGDRRAYARLQRWRWLWPWKLLFDYCKGRGWRGGIAGGKRGGAAQAKAREG
ncbi:MAG TPA: hypothetical protein VK081_03310 [Planctomycetota bacterium]|nr:hypothetical protein [Planctomycetota bacterium]